MATGNAIYISEAALKLGTTPANVKKLANAHGYKVSTVLADDGSKKLAITPEALRAISNQITTEVEFYSLKQAAQIWGVSTRGVREKVKRGEIPAINLGGSAGYRIPSWAIHLPTQAATDPDTVEAVKQILEALKEERADPPTEAIDTLEHFLRHHGEDERPQTTEDDDDGAIMLRLPAEVATGLEHYAEKCGWSPENLGLYCVIAQLYQLRVEEENEC